MSLPLRPVFARVILERQQQDKSAGGILLPNGKAFLRTKGKIIACGETCDPSIKALIGKNIYFANFAGDWLKHGDVEYYVCQDEDILAEILDE